MTQFEKVPYTARQLCPHSRATRGNIDVVLNVITMHESIAAMDAPVTGVA